MAAAADEWTPTLKLLVTCNQCAEEFLALYMPQPIQTAAMIMGRLTCPRCGNTKLQMTGHTRQVPV